MTPEKFLADLYESAMAKASGMEHPKSDLPDELKHILDILIRYSDKAKGVYTVVLTSVVYKILHPAQDIRKHQASIEGGYSGRGFDSHYITPFLKERRFPAMAESGWLTRSLEQKIPYDMDYTGAIKPDELKQAFLQTIHSIETDEVHRRAIADYLLQASIIKRDKQNIRIATPQNLSIQDIIALLEKHFTHPYHCAGAARLPVLALHAVYEGLIKECKRYKGKILLPLESHTAADTRSGRMADIDVTDADGTPFEAVEVKFDIPVSYAIVEIAKEKIDTSKIKRYYILSTKNPETKDLERITDTIRKVKNTHGCQLVVNGVENSLKYYLRLIENPSDFIDHYTQLLASDPAVKYEHKAYWNALVGSL